MKIPNPAIAACSILLHCFLSAEEPEDFRFHYEVLVSDIKRPMTMEMAPDGRIFFNELDGKLRLLDPSSKEVREVAGFEVYTEQESGLLGFALDPAFAENGHIFIQWSPKDFDGQVLSRYTIRDDVLDHGTQKELMRWPVQRRECCHHAGAIRFGPEGNLYISTGDNTSPFQSDGFTPIDERDDRYPFDAQKSSSNTNDLRGKILCIRPEADGTYSIPEGNLFKPGTEGTLPEIYAMGFRNPWRFSIDPKNGIMYLGDVGPDAGSDKDERGPRGFDTFNQIREPGFYGWPYVRGSEAYEKFDFEKSARVRTYEKQKPINDSPNNTGLRELPPVAPPMIWYAHHKSDEHPELGAGGRTACAGPVFYYDPNFEETGGFPKHFDGAVLLYDWQRPFVVWARMEGDAEFAGLEKFSESARVAQGDEDGSGRFQIKRPVDAFFGPDGCLYFMDYGETWGPNEDARIFKVSYQRGNLSPIAKASASVTAGREPLEVSLTAEGSSEPEGGKLSYRWTLQPEGRVFGEGETAELRVEKPGNYTAELTVTDSEGATATASIALTVGNTPPVVTFLKPRDNDFFEPGDKIEYEILIEDAEDGNSKDGPKAAQMVAETFVTTEWLRADGKRAETAVGMTLMKQTTCFNCHAVDQKLIGPSLVEIADRYRGQDGALNTATDRVLKGSAGVWGEIPMLPHAQHSKDELHMMVSWIFSLEKGKTGPAIARGTSGSLSAPDDGELRIGTIQAGFTDYGHGTAGPLSSTATVKVRNRLIEAEMADEIKGPKIAGFGKASGKKAIGHLSGGHYIRFDKVPLDQSGGLTVHAALPDGERKITVRTGGPEGEIIGEVIVKPTGDWNEWKEFKGSLKSTETRADVYFVFDGALNLDWVRFDP